MAGTTSDRRADAIDIAVGARVRVRRRLLNLSQSALAEALGISFQQVQKYERGANRVSASMLVKIGQRLGCSVASLVGEDTGAVHDALASQLVVSGAVEILDAYERIKSPAVRRRLLRLATSLADGDDTDVDDDVAIPPRRSTGTDA